MKLSRPSRMRRKEDFDQNEIEAAVAEHASRKGIINIIRNNYLGILKWSGISLVLGGAALGIAFATGHDSGSKEQKELDEEVHKAIMEMLRKEQDEKIKGLESKLEEAYDAKKTAVEARKNAEESEKRYKGLWREAEKLKETYESRIGNLTGRIDQFSQDISGLEETKKKLDEELKKTRETNTGLEKRLDASKRKIGTLQSNYDTKSREYAQLEEAKKKIQEAYDQLQEDVRKNVASAEAINSSIERDKKRLEGEKKKLEEELGRLRTEYETLEGKKAEIDRLYQDLTRDHDALVKRQGPIGEENERLKKKKEEQKRTIEKLEALVREYDEASKKAGARERLITETYEKKLADQETGHKRAMAEQKRIYEERIRGIVERTDQKKKELEERLQELTTDLAEMTTDRDQYKKKSEGQSGTITGYEEQQKKDQETIRRHGGTIASQDTKIKGLEGEKKGLEKRVQVQSDRITKLGKEIIRLNKEILSLGDQLKSTGTDKAGLQKKYDETVAERDKLKREREAMAPEYHMLYSTRIAYIYGSNLYISDGDPFVSRRVKRVLSTSESRHRRNPTISSNKKYVVFETSKAPGQSAFIQVYNIENVFTDGMNLVREINFDENLSDVEWIGNGRIAFIGGKKGEELWIYDIGGEKPVCLAKNDVGRIGQVAGSPDGKKIAYVIFSDYDEENACQVWVTEGAGKNRTRVTLEGNKYNTQPVWVNNDVLVYVKEGRSSDSEIQLVDLRRSEIWRDDKKWKYRNVTANIGCAWFPIVDLFSRRNKADFNPAVNSEGFILYTNESDGIVIKHPKKPMSKGLLDKPDDMPYETEEIIASKGDERTDRAIFYQDGKSILVKVGKKLFRYTKEDGTYRPHFVANVDEKSDFDIK